MMCGKIKEGCAELEHQVIAAIEPAFWQIAAAAIIFLVTYAIIITEKLNRAVIAIFGAGIMLLLGIVDLYTAFTVHIEWRTIFLLLGMMILVGMTNKTGIIQYLAIKGVQLAKGGPIRVLVILSLLTGAGSAFLDNVTMVLLIVPVTIAITRELKVNPVPYLISEIMACNIGGTATLIGNPANMMIGTANEHLSFQSFLIHMAPISIIIMIVTILFLVLVFRKRLVVTEAARRDLMKLNAANYLQDRGLLRKASVILALTAAGFLLHSVLNVEIAAIAIIGALLLMLAGVSKKHVEETIGMLEWKTLFFYIGLFIVVGGMIETGVITKLVAMTLQIASGDIAYTSMLILWVSGIASATIDHIPFVATMIPFIERVGVELNITHPEQLNSLWWSLALGASLGGNGTLIGSSANVIAAGLASKAGKGFGFMDFIKIGAPVTLLSLLISTVYVQLFLLP